MVAIIEVKNLTKQFKDVTAVNDLSFSVNEGDIYGFLGQNGAGKSTTIRMLLTLIKPTAGSIHIFSKNLHTHREEILTDIGAIIEKPDLYNYLSAYHNLSFFAKISGVKISKNKIFEQLEMVGLAARAHSKVKTFSQGMKQRLGIAAALIHNPKLLILDEPTNGLDPQGIADIRNLIISLSRKFGKTILVSSHLLTEIELIANRILIIDKGNKIVEGTSAVLLDPANTIVEVNTTDNASAKNQIAETRWKQYLQQTKDGDIILKFDKSLIPEFINQLVQMNVQVLSVKPRHSLEDYFLSLTTANQHVEPVTI
ncbi:MAG: ABC transporter ATP-binding protein [Ginsengibacter sp.]